MPDYRSVSQVKEYQKCGYAYYLNRIVKAWQRPAAWLPQGLAVHESAEAWERSARTLPLAEVEDVYRESYVKHTNRMCEDTPNFEFWFASGPYRGEADVERRFGLGLEQVSRYLTYYSDKAPDEKIWTTPDGTPAIELPFEIELDGVKVRGCIDQVVVKTLPDGQVIVIVRDIKSGNKPGDAFQLKVYAVAIEDQYGRPITIGDYWMGRTGKPTVPYELAQVTRQEVVDAFREADEGIRAERFDPDPEPSKCRFCPVASACSFSA